jgi:hypothetical protein
MLTMNGPAIVASGTAPGFVVAALMTVFGVGFLLFPVPSDQKGRVRIVVLCRVVGALGLAFAFFVWLSLAFPGAHR